VSRAFVDTTVLANILLKRDASRETCLRALERYTSTETPTYALKELKAGPLYNWIWLHNKCVASKSYRDVIRALSAMARSRRRNLPLTALEAWGEVANLPSSTLRGLVERYGADADQDMVLADRMRLSLRRRIQTAWRDRRTVASVVHPLPCYQEAELIVSHLGVIDARPTECNPTPNCSLAILMARIPETIRLLQRVCERNLAKAENVRRRKVLRHIARTPKRPIDDNMCRALGDAVFAVLAPSDSVILTTNLTDHKPLAEALGKLAESP
jgi:predicted nucleic acid-binding protein